jgi:uncharacterized membrane protein (DUF485 family)
MKKLMILFLVFAASLQANAQTKFDFLADRELTFDVLHSTVAIIVLYIIITFILSMTRLWMNFQLRKKLLDTDAPADVITQILLNKSETLNPLKWSVILISMGIGLSIISFMGPLNIQSVIVMTFCIALGFLTYFYIKKRFKS